MIINVSNPHTYMIQKIVYSVNVSISFLISQQDTEILPAASVYPDGSLSEVRGSYCRSAEARLEEVSIIICLLLFHKYVMMNYELLPALDVCRIQVQEQHYIFRCWSSVNTNNLYCATSHCPPGKHHASHFQKCPISTDDPSAHWWTFTVIITLAGTQAIIKVLVRQYRWLAGVVMTWA